MATFDSRVERRIGNCKEESSESMEKGDRKAYEKCPINSKVLSNRR
jgi:hypothetical protein